jgi:hypothetical protein
MHARHHLGPAFQRRLAVHHRDRRRIERRRVVDAGALGDDQPGAAFRPPPVIARDVRSRHAAGGELPRHRRHPDAVAQREATDLERREQGVGHRS